MHLIRSPQPHNCWLATRHCQWERVGVERSRLLSLTSKAEELTLGPLEFKECQPILGNIYVSVNHISTHSYLVISYYFYKLKNQTSCFPQSNFFFPIIHAWKGYCNQDVAHVINKPCLVGRVKSWASSVVWSAIEPIDR